MGLSLHHGEPHMIDHTPAGAVAAGDGVIIGGRVHIAHRAIAAGSLGALAAPSGKATYRALKAAGFAINAGDDVKWDTATQSATSTGTANVGLKAIAAAASGDTEVLVQHGS